MIYFDSSALVKLLVEEPESAALIAWVADREQVPKVSSELVKVEVVRAMWRLDPAGAPDARALVSELDLVPLSGLIIDQAGDAGDPMLRSLDAIHLLSALSVRDELTAFVAYDTRLTAAAQAAGLPVILPGKPSG